MTREELAQLARARQVPASWKRVTTERSGVTRVIVGEVRLLPPYEGGIPEDLAVCLGDASQWSGGQGESPDGMRPARPLRRVGPPQTLWALVPAGAGEEEEE